MCFLFCLLNLLLLSLIFPFPLFCALYHGFWSVLVSLLQRKENNFLVHVHMYATITSKNRWFDKKNVTKMTYREAYCSTNIHNSMCTFIYLVILGSYECSERFKTEVWISRPLRLCWAPWSWIPVYLSFSPSFLTFT